MDNVYRPTSKALSTPRKQIYMAILPGIRVGYRQQTDGSFLVLNIDLDDTYTRLQGEATRPGLWRAESIEEDTFHVEFVRDGKLDPANKDRFVIVSDRTDQKPGFVVDETYQVLKSSRDKTTLGQIRRNGFDLHYTPGKKRIGGWTNLQESYTARSCASLRESAELLAQTMRDASGISGVLWGSEGGGSGILTQAMQILADQGVKLESHGIFLNRATTLPSQAVALAHRLGIATDDVTRKSSFSLHQMAGQLCFVDIPISNLVRLRTDNAYTLGSLARDTARGSFDAIQNTHTTVGAAGFLGFMTATSPAISQVGGILALTSIAIKTLEKVAPEFSRRPLWPRK